MNKSITKNLAGCNAWAEEIRAKTGSRPDIYHLASQCIFITYGDVYSDTKNIHEICKNGNPVWQDTKDEDWKLVSKDWLTQNVIPKAKNHYYYDWYIWTGKDYGCDYRSNTDKTYTSEKEDQKNAPTVGIQKQKLVTV